MTNNLNSVYEIELAGMGLQLVRGTYQRAPQTPFAPRIATSNPSHGTLDAWQSQSITDWSHGFGFREDVDPQGYDFTSGNIDTRTPNELQMWTAQTTPTNSPAGQVNVLADFNDGTNNYLYAGLQTTLPTTNGSTVWRYTGSDWVSMHTITVNAGCPTTAVTDLLSSADNNGNVRLLVAHSDTSDVTMTVWNGGAWTTPLNAAFAKYFAHAGGYVWYADRTNNVRYSSDPTASWSNPVQVGTKAHAITSLVEFNGRLYIGKTNGLYYIDPSTTQGLDYAYPALKFDDEIHVSNFGAMKVWQGYLYFQVNNRFYRMSPAHALSDITPGKFTTTFPYALMQNFRTQVSGRKFLYYLAQDSSDSTWWQCAFDGVAHPGGANLHGGGPGGAQPSLRGACFSQATNAVRLWECTPATNAVSSTYYTSMNDSEIPYASYPTTNAGGHYLETSRMAFSLPEVVKNYKNIILEVENYSAGRLPGIQVAPDDSTTFFDLLPVANENTLQSPLTAVRTSYSESTTAVVGTEAWNVGQAQTADGVFDTVSLNAGQQSAYLVIQPTLTIPSTATITGIVVQVSRKASGTGIVDASVRLGTPNIIGTLVGEKADTATNWPSATTQKVYGANWDLWGRAWTPTDISNGIVVGISCTNNSGGTLTASIDYVNIIVYYIPAGTRYLTYTFDRVDGTVTSATNATLTDTANLTHPQGRWIGAVADIVSGTGAGQSRIITAYDAASNTVTLNHTWDTPLDTTSIYQITWQSRLVRFRIYFNTTSSSNTLVIKSFTIRFEPRPELKLGWTFVVRAGNLPEYNTGAIQETITAEGLASLARYWRNTKAPLKFVDVDGTTRYVMLTDFKILEGGYDPTETETISNREYNMQMTLAEA